MLALFVHYTTCYFFIGLSIFETPICKNFVSCSQFFSLPAIVPDKCYNLRHNQTIVNASDWTRSINVPVSTITQLFALITIRDGVFRQFSVDVDGNVLTIEEVKSLIYLICTT